MSREDLQTLAALEALGLLEGEEAAQFERELASNPEARAALASYSETADIIGLTAEEREPPADLEARLFDALPEQRAAAPMVPPATAPAASASLLSWIPWGIAAGLGMACAYLLSERAEQRQALTERDAHIRRLEQEGALDNLRIAVLKSQLASAPNAQAVAIWDHERQQGRLAVSNLPAVPEGKEYQLWIIDPALEGPVSAGVFNTDLSGAFQYAFSGAASIGTVNAFALSVEREGGAPSPEGPIVLVSE